MLYTQLQHTMEDIHGLRNAQSALALRSIADVHMMLKEYGAPSWPALHLRDPTTAVLLKEVDVHMMLQEYYAPSWPALQIRGPRKAVLLKETVSITGLHTVCQCSCGTGIHS